MVESKLATNNYKGYYVWNLKTYHQTSRPYYHISI